MFRLTVLIAVKKEYTFTPYRQYPGESPTILDSFLFEVATKLLMMSNLNQHCQLLGRAAWCSLSFFMKKFFVFILFLLLLIISEYFLLNELFAQKRMTILSLSLFATIFFLVAIAKFFKKYILHTKQPEAHS